MFATLTVQEKKQLLSFVIVGGGPTGVEVAAELQDMVETDLVKVYPDLIKDVRIAVIELQDHVLSTYDRRISDYTRQIFNRYVSHYIRQTHIGLHQTDIQSVGFSSHKTDPYRTTPDRYSTGMFLITYNRPISDYTRQRFNQCVSGSVAGAASEWVYYIVAVKSVLAVEPSCIKLP